MRRVRIDTLELQDVGTPDTGHSSSSSSSLSSDSSFDSELRKSQRKKARHVHKTNRRADKNLRKHPSRAADIVEKRVSGPESMKQRGRHLADLAKGRVRRVKGLRKV